MALPDPFRSATVRLPGARTPAGALDTASSTGLRLVAPIAILVVLIISFQRLAQPDLAAVYRDPLILLTTVAAALAGLGLLALHRDRIAGQPAVLSVGIGFAAMVALVIALAETVVPLPADRPVLGISAVGPWILLFSLLARNRPGATLAAGLIAASMWPIAYAINLQRHGFALAPWGRLIVWPGINYLIAVLAAVIGRRIDGTAATAETADDLGRYRLLAPIGAGGMGEVWKASHEMLARQAAIKLVRPRTTASSARQADLRVERFRREANVIAGLQSPHTIYLYDFGVSRDRRFYYVMELLDGINLQTLVTTFGPQPAGRVRSIALQICASLDEAHQRNLVHRDLKPSNVMLCKLALTYDFVKVLDFGLAKCAACEDMSQLTMEGTAAGTPGYIAPEVALGEEHVDGRADIYALGCLVYYLLTGTLVFPDSNPMTMALRHVQSRPDPPSARTAVPIPADLERIVMQCLEKRPSDRPASARGVAALFEACQLVPWTQAEAVVWWETHLPATSSLRLLTVPVATDAPTVERA
ncbi:MAG: serine/threonine-protein kinase [Acidobacteriota bacterium]